MTSQGRPRTNTPHALVIRGIIHAQTLPPPGVDGITEDERRAVRNKLKAMRKAHRK